MNGPSSAQRKLGRGIEHVRQLRDETVAFENREAYVLRTEMEQRSPQEVEYRCLVVERERPPGHWPLLAGDAVQNLRASLDHAVHALSRSSRSQFPIFTNRCEFQVRGRPMLNRVPGAVRTLIERAQPYETFPDAPTVAPLAVLALLANRDKHRMLATVAANTDLVFASFTGQVRFEWHSLHPFEGMRLHDGAQIAWFTASSDTELLGVDVNPGFAYEVRVERWRIEYLVAIARRVFEVIWECENRQPFPLMTPAGFYPI